jgi:hypothetical protein
MAVASVTSVLDWPRSRGCGEGLPDSFEFFDADPEWPEEEPDYGND